MSLQYEFESGKDINCFDVAILKVRIFSSHVVNCLIFILTEINDLGCHEKLIRPEMPSEPHSSYLCQYTSESKINLYFFQMR